MLPEPAYQHGVSSRVGILLINLGTPAAPTAKALRPYLKQFLSEPRIIELPRWFWWFILNGIILNTRPAKSARKYEQIWMPEGSPLKVHTEKQTALLASLLQEQTKYPLIVEYAMSIGTPSIKDTLWKMRERGCDRILVMPLFPQYAASSSGCALESVFCEFGKMRNMPALRTIKHFHDKEVYIAALAENIKDYWAEYGQPGKLVMSFHGVPRKTLDAGDPYHCECHKTGRLLAKALSLSNDQYQVCFQSRFGLAKWLGPYTSEILEELGKQKLNRIDVVCPGFVSDCLETLEEIAIEGKAIFIAAGGEDFHYIPALNEHPAWINALSEMVRANLVDWLDPQNSGDDAEHSRKLALQLGALQ